jgi:hypothetical protein
VGSRLNYFTFSGINVKIERVSIGVPLSLVRFSGGKNFIGERSLPTIEPRLLFLKIFPKSERLLAVAT